MISMIRNSTPPTEPATIPTNWASVRPVGFIVFDVGPSVVIGSFPHVHIVDAEPSVLMSASVVALHIHIADVGPSVVIGSSPHAHIFDAEPSVMISASVVALHMHVYVGPSVVVGSFPHVHIADVGPSVVIGAFVEPVVAISVVLTPTCVVLFCPPTYDSTSIVNCKRLYKFYSRRRNSKRRNRGKGKQPFFYQSVP